MYKYNIEVYKSHFDGSWIMLQLAVFHSVSLKHNFIESMIDNVTAQKSNILSEQGRPFLYAKEVCHTSFKFTVKCWMLS